MCTRAAIIVAGLAAGKALAQSTSVVQLFAGSASQANVVASVVGVSPSQTTYLLNCPSGTAPEQCEVRDLTVAAGETSWDAVTNDPTQSDDPYRLSYAVHCQMVSSTLSPTCTENAVDSQTQTVSQTVSAYATSDYSLWTVTITAGLEKLASPTGSTTATGSTSSGSAMPASSISASSASATSQASSAAASATGNVGYSHQVPLFGAAVGAGAALLAL